MENKLRFDVKTAQKLFTKAARIDQYLRKAIFLIDKVFMV